MKLLSGPVKPGDIFTARGVEWREGWEFDHPIVLLTPVRRYSPNGDSPEGMIESLCIDCAVDGHFPESDDVDIEFASRGWSWQNLERVYWESQSGKAFPVKMYRAFAATCEAYVDEDGELAVRYGPITIAGEGW